MPSVPHKPIADPDSQPSFNLRKQEQSTQATGSCVCREYRAQRKELALQKLIYLAADNSFEIE